MPENALLHPTPWQLSKGRNLEHPQPLCWLPAALTLPTPVSPAVSVARAIHQPRATASLTSMRERRFCASLVVATSASGRTTSAGNADQTSPVRSVGEGIMSRSALIVATIRELTLLLLRERHRGPLQKPPQVEVNPMGLPIVKMNPVGLPIPSMQALTIPFCFKRLEFNCSTPVRRHSPQLEQSWTPAVSEHTSLVVSAMNSTFLLQEQSHSVSRRLDPRRAMTLPVTLSSWDF